MLSYFIFISHNVFYLTRHEINKLVVVVLIVVRHVLISENQTSSDLHVHVLTVHTVPLKGKLTVSTRNSILDPRSFRESRIEFRGSSFEFRFSRIESRVSKFKFRVSRHSKNFSRISNRDFEKTI